MQENSEENTEPAVPKEDLGFTYSIMKSGDVEVKHHGRLASTLRGKDAAAFVQKIQEGDAQAQQLMARVTGNYKRGNERTATQHPRNHR